MSFTVPATIKLLSAGAKLPLLRTPISQKFLEGQQSFSGAPESF
jgi:hypothetical protein